MKREVTLEVIYPYPPDRVWRALTDRRVLAQWLLPNDFEPRVGHRFHFVQPVHAGRREVIECEVIEIQRPLRLSYTWRDSPRRAPSRVTWSLEPVAGGTRLRLEYAEVEDAAAAAGATDDAAVAHAWDHRLAALLALLRSEDIPCGEGRWQTTGSSAGRLASSQRAA